MPAHCESNIFIQDTERMIPVVAVATVSTSLVEAITAGTRLLLIDGIVHLLLTTRYILRVHTTMT